MYAAGDLSAHVVPRVHDLQTKPIDVWAQSSRIEVRSSRATAPTTLYIALEYFARVGVFCAHSCVCIPLRTQVPHAAQTVHSLSADRARPLARPLAQTVHVHLRAFCRALAHHMSPTPDIYVCMNA